MYSGNGHTTSRVAAGMVFLSFGVVAAGRVIHKPTKPLGKKRIAKLRKNPKFPAFRHYDTRAYVI